MQFCAKSRELTADVCHMAHMGPVRSLRSSLRTLPLEKSFVLTFTPMYFTTSLQLSLSLSYYI